KPPHRPLPNTLVSDESSSGEPVIAGACRAAATPGSVSMDMRDAFAPDPITVLVMAPGIGNGR
ncbi:hypothetical protein AB4144_42750, partial [Rhizobiaceae sp. 2RAB30]